MFFSPSEDEDDFLRSLAASFPFFCSASESELSDEEEEEEDDDEDDEEELELPCQFFFSFSSISSCPLTAFLSAFRDSASPTASTADWSLRPPFDESLLLDGEGGPRPWDFGADGTCLSFGSDDLLSPSLALSLSPSFPLSLFLSPSSTLSLFRSPSTPRSLLRSPSLGRSLLRPTSLGLSLFRSTSDLPPLSPPLSFSDSRFLGGSLLLSESLSVLSPSSLAGPGFRPASFPAFPTSSSEADESESDDEEEEEDDDDEDDEEEDPERLAGVGALAWGRSLISLSCSRAPRSRSRLRFCSRSLESERLFLR